MAIVGLSSICTHCPLGLSRKATAIKTYLVVIESQLLFRKKR